MSPHPIEERLLPLFAKYLFKGYVKKFGYSKASLDKYEIPVAISNPPRQFRKRVGDTKHTTCVAYLSEMKHKNYLTQEGGFYKFTEAGFDFGHESPHPFQHWHKKNWAWFYGVLIVGVLMILATLLSSALSAPIKSLLQKTTGS